MDRNSYNKIQMFVNVLILINTYLKIVEIWKCMAIFEVRIVNSK